MGAGRQIFSACTRLALRARGVDTGRGLVFFGLPIVERHAGSSIALGHRVVLCSTCAGNPLGVNHPVILRTLRAGSAIRIGDDTGLSGAAVCAARSVSIGAGCLIGANAAITDCDFHAVAPENRRYNTSPDAVGCAPVIIGDNVWIGMNVIILKGVTIGRNSIIGAGSVVTKSIPPDCFAAGQPAVVRRQLSSAEDAAALRTRADGSAG